jgi:hypothetical protein
MVTDMRELKKNYTIEELNLLQRDRVPEDAALLIVAI